MRQSVLANFVRERGCPEAQHISLGTLIGSHAWQCCPGPFGSSAVRLMSDISRSSFIFLNLVSPMRRSVCGSLLTACLTLCGCATSTPQSKSLTKASLDSALAAACPAGLVIGRPPHAKWVICSSVPIDEARYCIFSCGN